MNYLPSTYKELFLTLDTLIKQYDLHHQSGPIDLKPIFDDLNIDVKYTNLPLGTHGKAYMALLSKVPASILIRQKDPVEIQHETGAHELVHIIKHAHNNTYERFDGACEGLEEEEAETGAAYLLVPLSDLKYYTTICGFTSKQIAQILMVTPEMVERRYEMARLMGEL